MKTVPTGASVDEFLAASGRDRAELDALVALLGDVTEASPVMWGDSIVGFGDRVYATAAGDQAFFEVGFSPRSSSLAIYGVLEAPGADDLLPRLGRHRRTKACLHLTRLDAVDADVLGELIELAVGHWRAG
jgi:hypothetical protein